MNMIMFLAFVAVCAIALAWMISRSSRQRKRDRKTAKAARKHTRPLYRQRMAGHSMLHTHTGHLPSETKDIWHRRRPQSTRDHWDEHDSITATRIRSDEEIEQDPDEEMTMSTIEFTSEEVSEASGGKR